MVHLLTSGSRYRQFSLLVRDDRGFLTIRLRPYVLRGNIPDRAHVSPVFRRNHVTYRSFLSELSKPFDLARSAATRVVSDCPRLKAAIRRTPWLASPSGLHEYRSRVWFDDRRYHAIVMVRKMIDGQPSEAFVHSRHGEFHTFRAARKTAQMATSALATLTVLTRQD